MFYPVAELLNNEGDYIPSAVYFHTFDRIEMGHWEWPLFVSLAETHLLIRNMTFLCHNVTHVNLM